MTRDELRANADVELEAQHFLKGVFEDRRKQPRDDLISKLHEAGLGVEGETVVKQEPSVHRLAHPGGVHHVVVRGNRHPQKRRTWRGGKQTVKVGQKGHEGRYEGGGLMADAASSGLYVMGKTDALRWLNGRTDAAAVLIHRDHTGGLSKVRVIGPLEVEPV